MYCKNCGKALIENEACTCQSMQNPKKGLDIKALLTAREQMPMKLVSITIFILAIKELVNALVMIYMTTFLHKINYLYESSFTVLAVVIAAIAIYIKNKSIVEKEQGEDYSFLCLILPFSGLLGNTLVDVFISYFKMIYRLVINDYSEIQDEEISIFFGIIIPFFCYVFVMIFIVYIFASISIGLEKRHITEKLNIIKNTPETHIINDRIGYKHIIPFAIVILITRISFLLFPDMEDFAANVFSVPQMSPLYFILSSANSIIERIVDIILATIAVYIACYSINKKSGYFKTGAYFFVAFLFPVFITDCFVYTVYLIHYLTIPILPSHIFIAIGNIPSIFYVILPVIFSFVGIRMYEGFREKNDAKIMADCE